MRKLDAGVHVVSGTPGRVKDMMEKQKVRRCSRPVIRLLLMVLLLLVTVLLER
jgi:hypothetical protein